MGAPAGAATGTEELLGEVPAVGGGELGSAGGSTGVEEGWLTAPVGRGEVWAVKVRTKSRFRAYGYAAAALVTKGSEALHVGLVSRTGSHASSRTARLRPTSGA